MKIAFGYKMRSGKDTSVEYLIKKYGGEKISFSQPLYEALYAVQEIFAGQRQVIFTNVWRLGQGHRRRCIPERRYG